MQWSEDGSEVTMSKAEYETLLSGYTTFTCHCGFEAQVFRFGGPGDGYQCEACGCYASNSGDDCILEKRKLYPYLQTVVDYISTLAHQKESYVSLKVGKQFNLTPEEVHAVRVEIALMNRS